MTGQSGRFDEGNNILRGLLTCVHRGTDWQIGNPSHVSSIRGFPLEFRLHVLACLESLIEGSTEVAYPQTVSAPG